MGFPDLQIVENPSKMDENWGKTIVNQAFGNGNSMGMPAKIVTGGW